MARKKKSAKREKIAAADFAPFPPPDCNAPVWSHLWTLLAVGFALRLLAAFSSDWTYRADEIMQYLEQAHRFVFGSGFMPWEIRIGARNMLLVAPAAGLMALCESAGGGTDCYIPAIKFLDSSLSLVVPASLYFVGRRVYGETAGRVALAVGCLWYEFIVLAPHLMAEQTATILILAGLACVPAVQGKGVLSRESGNPLKGNGFPLSRERIKEREWIKGREWIGLWLAGFFIGLGGLLRLPYIPVAGLLGLLILWRTPVRFAPHLIGGAFVSLLVAGTADYVAWGGFYHSAFSYLEAASLTDNFGDVHGETPWHIQLRKMAVCSFGLWPAVLIAAAADWRRHWLALGIAVVVLVVHAAVNSHIYTHVILVWAALALALGGIASRPPAFLRAVFRGGNKLAAAGVVVAISLAGATHLLPGLAHSFWWDFKHPRFFFYEHPAAPVGRFLSGVAPERMRGALWTGVDPLWTGGYFYFHHNAPYWHEGLASHREMLRGRALSETASFVAAPDPQGAQRALAAGFREVANFGGVRVFENPEPERVAPGGKFPLGMGHRDDVAIDRALERAGKVAPAERFLPSGE